jgi:aminoglycoside 3-N-acetyltransferase
MIARSTLLGQLKSLGVCEGATLMVHASLRRTGPIDGGADALLDSLFEAIGPDGTLVMPLGADDDEPFDARSSPAEDELGVLPEVFRKRPETQVNDHAAARFGASGAGAHHLLEPIPLHDYYGTGSVLSRFTEQDGLVLRLGADADTVTLTHYAEYLADIPNKRRVRIGYERADSGEQWIEGLDDSHGIADWSGGDYFPQILVDYLAAGNGSIGPVGNCDAELIAGKSFVAFAKHWIESRL